MCSSLYFLRLPKSKQNIILFLSWLFHVLTTHVKKNVSVYLARSVKSFWTLLWFNKSFSFPRWPHVALVPQLQHFWAQHLNLSVYFSWRPSLLMKLHAQQWLFYFINLIRLCVSSSNSSALSCINNVLHIFHWYYHFFFF